jgi:hypothetical protein
VVIPSDQKSAKDQSNLQFRVAIYGSKTADKDEKIRAQIRNIFIDNDSGSN